jgi:peptide/nickel transport system substrate-binding protein
MDRRRFLKLTATAAAAVPIGMPRIATTPARAESPRTLSVAWDTDIDTLDPASFKSIGAYTTQANIYDSPLMWKVQPVPGSVGLYRSQPGQFDGSIADSWAFENDGATLVLNIRRGITFPSGRPVNARAVRYLFDRGLQSPGYMKLMFQTMLRITKPEQFEVRDDYTLAINMPGPTLMALDVVALSNNALLDPDEVKQHATAADPWAGDWLKRNTAGLGPYELVKNDPGIEIVIAARNGHWRAPPYFQRVVFKFVPNESDRMLLLKRRLIDMVVGRPGLSPKSVKSLEGEAGLKIVSVPDTTCHWLCMNTRKPPFDNVKVRQAVSYAIPIQAIVPNVLHGYGVEMKSPVPSLTPGHDATLSPYRHDIDKARALMKDAGLGADPIPVDFAIRFGWLPHEQASVLIQAELEKIGFKVDIFRESDATFRQLASKGDHQLSIESWQSWINDPFYHLFFNFHSKAKATNTAFYSNPEVDRLIDDNMHSVDTGKRLAAARQAQKIVIDDAVWGMLWYDNWTRVMRSDLVGVEKRWDTFERYFNMKLA